MKKKQMIMISILCSFFLLISNGSVKATTESDAAQWLAAQVDKHSKRLYVYSDYSDSKCAFTQRGFMGVLPNRFWTKPLLWRIRELRLLK